MRLSRKSTLIAIGGCLLFSALTVTGFIYAGTFLIAETPPGKADAGFVLAGDFTRASYAADLYQEGFIPRIWLSRPERERSLRHLDTVGVPYPRQEEINRSVLLKKGVPPEQIELLGNEVVSTIEEARALADVLNQRQDIHTVLLITSRFHVRRAEAIFKKVLGARPGFAIYAVGTPYDGFIADQWWTDRESARQVVLETAKWLLFWIYTEF